MSEEDVEQATADAVDDGLGDLTSANGPWDVADAPADAEFYDFGVLRLPARPGLKARLEIDPKFDEIGAVTIRIADCALQLQVIAKQRGVSLWTDTRQALLANLRNRPGYQQVIEGRYGTEVIGVLTGRTTEGVLVDATMRFQGIEGDDWMIRAVSSGPSVTHDDVVARVDAFISLCAVDRSAMEGAADAPAGSVLALRAPAGEVAADDAAADEPEADEA
ncbi:DUF3710 domain-containing protein [Demequina sp.]|uniref:DUF3710 domain-containing protein n=1 Tax=Demequina sp. TaxID=2050685 RepID=UPI003D0A0499